MSAHRPSHTSRHAGTLIAAVSTTAAIVMSAWARVAGRRRTARLRTALLATLALMLGAIALSPGYAPAASTTSTLEFLRSQRDACQVMLDSATGTSSAAAAARTRARNCITDTERAIAALLATPTPAPSVTPSVTPSPSPTATPGPTVSPTVVPTSPSPSMSPTPSQPPTPTPTVTQTTPPSSWPGPDNTGVPAGTTLSVYTGPCRITTPGTVIDAKLVSCDLDIATTGVRITRSSIGGTVSVDSPTSETAARLTISDSVIDAGHRQATGLGDGLFVATKLEVRGGNRGVLCAWRCELRDSWVHGTYVQDDWHASGVRAERYSTIVHNTLNCSISPPTAQDGGCSADLTGYPDFVAVHDWVIDSNLFVANVDAAFCAYGGASPGKPFSGDPTNATNIRFTNNTFERGPNRRCAAYGPVDSWAGSRPGNVWSNNRWADDGSLVVP